MCGARFGRVTTVAASSPKKSCRKLQPSDSQAHNCGVLLSMIFSVLQFFAFEIILFFMAE